MKNLFFALAIALLLCGCTSIANKDHAMRYPKLNNFYQKMEQGDKVTIAYFGGSITWGATATDPMRTSYRAQVTTQLKAAYPKAHIDAIDAAIGGKGTDLAVFRVDRDVIPKNPDLTFVEFAVNDAGIPKRIESFEGILRKLHNSNPNMAIVVIIVGSGKNEYVSPNANAYSSLAEYYGLPVINIVNAVNEDIKKGKYIPTDILTDTVHPNDFGYKIYTNIIMQELNKLAYSKGESIPFATKPQTKNHFEFATMIPLASLVKNNEQWKTTIPSVVGAWFDHQPSRWLDSVIIPNDANAELEVELNCSGIGTYYETSNNGDDFIITVDDIELKAQSTKFGQQYPGLGNNFIFLDKLDSHKIKISAKGKNLALAYLFISQ